MAIQASDLIAKFYKPLNEKWGYILNATGGVWTASQQHGAEEAYKKALASNDQKGIDRWKMTAEYGSQWVGKHVIDCSGMFYWAFRQLGGYMYHGSNTMWSKYTTSKGTLSKGKRTDGKELLPGTAVFKIRETDYYHVGLYVGDGKVIEAQGTRTGVTTSKITAWHAWGELKGVNYTTKKQEVIPMDYKEAVVTADGGVNLRSSASTSSIKLAVIPKNAKIKAAQHDATWSKVEYAGKTGYAMTQFIQYTDGNETDDEIFALIGNMEKELAKLKAMLQA